MSRCQCQIFLWVSGKLITRALLFCCGDGFRRAIRVEEGPHQKTCGAQSIHLSVYLHGHQGHTPGGVLLSDTEEFLAAFHRFSHRRRTPEVVFSDNGSNFVGASKELKQIQKMLHDSEHSVSHLSAAKEIKWHHTPPRSPTLGAYGRQEFVK